MGDIESDTYINILAILGCEFCERLARFGIASSLTLFLRSEFGYSTDTASTCYTLWCAFSYLFAPFGGYIADMYWGKKKTILVSAVIYACALSVLSISTYILDFASADLSIRAIEIICWIALYVLMLGSGGITSSVGLFGAAQLPTVDNTMNNEDDMSNTADADPRESNHSNADYESQNLIESYWNWFYFAMSGGPLISYTFITYLCQASFTILLHILSVLFLLFPYCMLYELYVANF